MTEQLALPLDAPVHLSLSAYARRAIGLNAPLDAGELAALAHHGYTLTATSETGVYAVVGQIDGRDGAMDADDLRSDLDLFYLSAKREAHDARLP